MGAEVLYGQRLLAHWIIQVLTNGLRIKILPSRFGMLVNAVI